jgi:hypothetical protein
MTDTLDWPWELEAGEDEILIVPITQNGAPVDVKGWALEALVRPVEGSRQVLYTFPADALTTVHAAHQDPAAHDAVQLRVPAAVSRSWAPVWSSGWWRLTVTSTAADPVADRVVQGPFVVHPD